MVTQVTNGIKVSVDTSYEGRLFRKNGSLYVFSYHVEIENQSSDTVQLLGRHWFIYDTGDGPSEVQGAGIVGKQPILNGGDNHRYQSGCHLRSSIGAMNGVYNMINLYTQETFEVKVPTFQFFATPRLN